ncbi:Metallo-dependent phosphatase-like protein [Gloeopeniophorella convolvens]|nr:Metallo-dependent phosphatase-like protein [Gloeopeniophorella convolvens]
MKTLAALAAALALGARPIVACPDDEHHTHARRAEPSVPLTPPTRPLVWGDINIIHTTDTHGWLLGHQEPSAPEPNYSGDFGDFASFVYHMNQTAIEKGHDLLLVDTGDLHDGTGLSDGYPNGEIDGQESDEWFAKLPYDVLTIGNHELYSNAVAHNMHTTLSQKFPGRYLTSNVNITTKGVKGSVPIGSRSVIFQTRKGRKVLALGVIFNATNLDTDIVLQSAEAMVNEEWFKEVIKEKVDLILLTGHMPVKGKGSGSVFDRIRVPHPTTPIIILGGHTHIRDCKKYDGKSMALESGSYMETVGWLSTRMNMTSPDPSGNLSFSRRYLDGNRVTYKYHTQNDSFDTPGGLEVTQGLQNVSSNFHLEHVFGNATQDYLLFRVPSTANNSALKLFVEQAIPVALSNATRAKIPKFLLIGSGALRYDIFKGPFNRNDQFTASSYADAFWYIPDIKLGDARKVADIINGKPGAQVRSLEGPRDSRRDDIEEVHEIRRRWLLEMSERAGLETRQIENLTLGYVTDDECGPDPGDDTKHSPAVVSLPLPSMVTLAPPALNDSAPVDLVFLNFSVQSKVIPALKTVTHIDYTNQIKKDYTEIVTNQVLGIYAEQKWKGH